MAHGGMAAATRGPAGIRPSIRSGIGPRPIEPGHRRRRFDLRALRGRAAAQEERPPARHGCARRNGGRWPSRARGRPSGFGRSGGRCRVRRARRATPPAPAGASPTACPWCGRATLTAGSRPGEQPAGAGAGPAAHAWAMVPGRPGRSPATRRSTTPTAASTPRSRSPRPTGSGGRGGRTSPTPATPGRPSRGPAAPSTPSGPRRARAARRRRRPTAASTAAVAARAPRRPCGVHRRTPTPRRGPTGCGWPSRRRGRPSRSTGRRGTRTARTPVASGAPASPMGRPRGRSTRERCP